MSRPEVMVLKTATKEVGGRPAVYWHRALPPLGAEPIGDHTLEATSSRVAGTLAHRDELWDRCYRELMTNTESRLAQELVRLGGDCARIYDESIEPKRDEASGETWLHGRFSYVLYREPPRPQSP